MMPDYGVHVDSADSTVALPREEQSPRSQSPVLAPPAWSVSWSAALLIIWGAGSIAWFSLAAARLVRFGRLIAHGSAASAELEAAADRLACRFGLNRRPELRVCPGRVPPLLWSSLRGAMIVMPADLVDQMEPRQQAALVAHELAHYRRGDHWVRWIEALVLGLYWWHPVAWWASRRLEQAQEQCCDAWVVWALPDGAKHYAHTLLSTVEFLSAAQPVLPVAASGLGHAGLLKRRLEMILYGRRDHRLSWPSRLALAGITLMVLPWSAGRSAAENEEQTPVAIAEATSTTSADVKPSEDETIRGTVAGPNGEPIAGATVYAIGPTGPSMLQAGLLPVALPEDGKRFATPSFRIVGQTSTDEAGQFTVAAQPGGIDTSADLVIQAEGYGLTAIDTPGGNEVKIELRETVPIRGQLLTPNGSPAAGVVVSARTFRGGQCGFGVPRDAAENDLPPFWPRPVRSDSDGRFTIAGMPKACQVSLALSHPGFAYDKVTIDTGQGATEMSQAFEVELLPPEFSHSLGPARPVEGVVRTGDTGESVADVLIEVIPMRRHGGQSFFARTDEQGRYRINSQSAENYYIKAYLAADSGYLAADKRHDAWPAGAKSLIQDFTLDRGKLIRGRVVDGDTNRPIAGASVTYRAAKGNPGRNKGYEFRNPILTGKEGRFAVTGLSGKGYLLVETPERIYIRQPLVDSIYREPSMALGYTPVDIPSEGELQNDVEIRLRRGKIFTLQARGPDGERLPKVRAIWEGIDSVHDMSWNHGQEFTAGEVTIRGLDPQRKTRVFLVNIERKLGAVFDITAETGETVEIRLQPTATVTGQVVTASGEKARDAQVYLKFSLDPEIAKYEHKNFMRYAFYSNFLQEFGRFDPPPEGRFTIENVLPGAVLGVMAGSSSQMGAMATIGPLQPGEREDIGNLVLEPTPR